MSSQQDQYEHIQKLKYELWSEDPNLRLSKASPDKKIVAEGDSWFDYAPGRDILDNLKLEHGYEIYKVAEAGDTIENMAYGTEIRSNYSRKYPQIEETLNAIARHRPKAFLLSGGGNDLAGLELEAFINHKDSGLPTLREDYARYVLLTVFKNAFRYIAQRVWKIDSTIRIITHGYGHAIPDGRYVGLFGIKFAGPWLRPALAKKNVTNPAEAEGAIRALIDLLNEMLGQLQGELGQNFRYVDLRDDIARDDWVNELHLSDDAYKGIAQLFHEEINKDLSV